MKYTIYSRNNTVMLGAGPGEFAVWVLKEDGSSISRVSSTCHIVSQSRAHQVAADYCEQFGVPIGEVQ